jgi:hypothetical protein
MDTQEEEEYKLRGYTDQEDMEDALENMTAQYAEVARLIQRGEDRQEGLRKWGARIGRALDGFEAAMYGEKRRRVREGAIKGTQQNRNQHGPKQTDANNEQEEETGEGQGDLAEQRARAIARSRVRENSEDREKVANGDMRLHASNRELTALMRKWDKKKMRAEERARRNMMNKGSNKRKR